MTLARNGWLRGIKVESSKWRIEAKDVTVEGEPAIVVRMVRRALETDDEAVDPVEGGRSEKKVSEGYVVI